MKREKQRGEGFGSNMQQLAGPDLWNALVASFNDDRMTSSRPEKEGKLRGEG